MRRFRFSLETVLKVKRTREERAQQVFSEAQRRRAAALMELGLLEHGLRSMNETEGAGRGQRLLAGAVALFEGNRRAQGERIAAQRGRVAEAEKISEEKRAELVEAQREKRVLEKLEEAQVRAHLDEVNREQQAFMDELARFSASRSMA